MLDCHCILYTSVFQLVGCDTKIYEPSSFYFEMEVCLESSQLLCFKPQRETGAVGKRKFSSVHIFMSNLGWTVNPCRKDGGM